MSTNLDALIQLQTSILSNEELMASIYRRAIGNPETIANEVFRIANNLHSASIKKVEETPSKYANPYCNISDYSNPYSL
jgi:hypothetical protein